MRFNFPYAERGRRSPDTERVLRETWLAAFEAASSCRSTRAGRRQVAGRQDRLDVRRRRMPAAGLVFLGYPLHPPGRPERIRDEHLYRVEVPMLFLQGTADPFARPELVAKVMDRLGERATLEEIEGRPFVEGSSHSRRPRGGRCRAAGLAAPFVRRVAGLPDVPGSRLTRRWTRLRSEFLRGLLLREQGCGGRGAGPHPRPSVRPRQRLGRRPAQGQGRERVSRLTLLERVRRMAPRPHRGSRGRDEGAVRIRLRRPPPATPLRADRLPLPSRGSGGTEIELAAHELLQLLDKAAA